MPTPDDRIDRLIERWAQAFGERLSREEGRAAAERILHLYRRLLQHYRRRNADVGDVRDVREATPPS
jgi:GTP cyclohydrolase I